MEKILLTDENLNQLAQIIEAGEKCNTRWYQCKENNVPKIIIQCVLSEEMASFCLKHGFVPNTNTCIMKNGTILKEYLSGDYELFLE